MAVELVNLKVTGADAMTFLQGQLTADVKGEMEGLAGLCNIKGRLEAIFFFIREGDTVNLILPLSIAESVKNILQKYIMRSKVMLEIEPVASHFVIKDELTIPWITTETQGKYVPQMVSLDVLGGVHPKKGCYVGQEIVTRLRDLGKNKKRLAHIEFIDELSEDDVIEGIVRIENHHGLAVVNLEKVNTADFSTKDYKISKIWKSETE